MTPWKRSPTQAPRSRCGAGTSARWFSYPRRQSERELPLYTRIGLGRALGMRFLILARIGVVQPDSRDPGGLLNQRVGGVWAFARHDRTGGKCEPQRIRLVFKIQNHLARHGNLRGYRLRHSRLRTNGRNPVIAKKTAATSVARVELPLIVGQSPTRSK